jgi:ATP-dependent helicase/nuclease subunit B
MAARVCVITGPARSGKTSQLLDTYCQALRTLPVGACLWLVPTQRTVRDIRQRLVDADAPACLLPGVMTFAQFADAVLAASGRPVRRLDPRAQRRLIHWLIQEEHRRGRLRYFAPIAHTSGLLDQFVEWIVDLKRLEIWPDAFRHACQRRGMTDKDREFLAVYQAYQHWLLQLDYYDAEGRFWAAHELLRGGQTAPFDDLRLVVVDGFTDFTRTQHETLALLATRTDDLLLTLPLEDGDARRDLFAKCHATLDRLRQHHPDLQVIALPRHSGDCWPIMAHLESQLFGNPRRPVPPPECSGIEILPAVERLGELQLIGRTIKDLLLHGDPRTGQRVRPGDVAVVFRSLAPVAATLREVFDALGLPYAIESARPLGDARIGAALLTLLRLHAEDWPFATLLAVLGSSYFRPPWPCWAGDATWAAVHRVLLQLQVPQGADAVVEQCSRLAAQLRRQIERHSSTADGDDTLASLQAQLDDVLLTLQVLQGLRDALHRLPHEATPRQWAQALQLLADDVGLTRAFHPPQREHDRLDQAAWDSLLASLQECETLLAELQPQPRPWSLDELLEGLHDLLRSEALPADPDETGRIRVLSAASARTLQFPYLFFAGLDERSFPAPEHEGHLYSEAQKEQLQQQGLPIPLRTDRHRNEMLLFYEVLSRATRHLWLSYPAVNQRAEPLLPSPYLEEVQRLCGPQATRPAPTQLTPVPLPVRAGRPAEPLSPAEFRILAVERALRGRVRWLSALDLLPGLQMIHDRARREGFGRFEGIVSSRAAQAVLRRQFGPSRLWSVSHLEQYATCPYQFFLQHVLHVEPLPELILDIDRLQRGGLLHRLLRALHEQLRRLSRSAPTPATLDEEQYEQLCQELLQQLVAPSPHEPPLVRALCEIDRRVLTQALAQYRQQHADYDQQHQADECFIRPPVPRYFEVSFGLPLRGDSTAPSSPEPLVLDAGGLRVRFCGRIDRIDVAQVQTPQGRRAVFQVIDYKSGRGRGAPSGELDGTDIQLEIYCLAAQQLLSDRREAIPWACGYWFVGGNGFLARRQLCHIDDRGLALTDHWQDAHRQLRRLIGELIGAVRCGQFPVFSRDERCTSYCEYSTVCRIGQVRALEKQWQPASHESQRASADWTNEVGRTGRGASDHREDSAD